MKIFWLWQHDPWMLARLAFMANGRMNGGGYTFPAEAHDRLSLG